MILICSVLAFLADQASCRSGFVADLLDHQKYNWELLLVGLLAMLVFYYFKGMAENKQVVSKFLDNCLECFKKNFYHVGLKLTPFESLQADPEILMQDESILEQDSPNFYRIYMTGRYNAKYCILSINTKRRQDLVVSLIYSIFWPEKDRVLLECALPDHSSEKGIFYILQKNKVK